MKDKEHGQLASLTQTRDTLAKLRTALKNKVNNILSARGLNLPKEALSSEKKLNEVLALPFDEIVQIELRVIVEQIRSLNKSIAELGDRQDYRSHSAERDRRCQRLCRRRPLGQLFRDCAAGLELEPD